MRHYWVAASRKPDVERPAMIRSCNHLKVHLLRIGWRYDRHVRERAHQRDILNRHVRRAKWCIAQAPAVSDEPHIQIMQADIYRDLLKASSGEERRYGVHVDNLSFECHARRHADDVLLLYPLHEEAIRHFLFEFLQYARAEIRADKDYAGFALRQFVDLLKTGIAQGRPRLCRSCGESRISPCDR